MQMDKKTIESDMSPLSPGRIVEGSLISNDQEIMDISIDDDDGAGRVNLAKYTSGSAIEQTRVHTDPAEEVQPQQADVTGPRKFSADSVKKSIAGGPSKMSYIAANDAYFRELQGFVDNTLRTVAGKIAEKKAVELDTAAFKAQIVKLREDMKKEELIQKSFQKTISLEEDAYRKQEQNSRELLSVLNAIKNRIATKKAEIDKKNADLEKCSEQSQQNLEDVQMKFSGIKTQVEESRETTRIDIKRLENKYAAAFEILAGLKKTVAQTRVAEQERVKMLRQKTRILATLIGQESSAGRSMVHQDIYRILKTPSRQCFLTSQRSKA